MKKRFYGANLKTPLIGFCDWSEVKYMENLISVIVPIYNVAPYLHECIDSIINQTYKNLEIILVDDGSTDDSGKICDEYLKKDNRIIVIHQKNQGVTLARKNGLKVSNGQYIGFVDGDDCIVPQMYFELHECIVKTDADFVDSGLIKKEKNGIESYRDISNNTILLNSNKKINSIIYQFLSLDRGGQLPNNELVSKLIKRDLIINIQNLISNDLTYGEDLISTMYLIQNSKKIVIVGKHYYYYRTRENSASRQIILCNMMSGFINFLKSLYAFFHYFGYDDKYKKIANLLIISVIISNSNRLQDDISKKIVTYKFKDKHLINNKNIILYGAGVVGISYYNFYNKDANIVCWTDKQYKNLVNYPIKIESPDKIINYNFDYLLIAVKERKLADIIKKDLISKHIPEDKILWRFPETTLDWLLK